MRIDTLADETYAEDALSTTEIGRSLGTDYFGLRDELTDAERVVNTMTHGFWGEGKTLRTPGWLPKPPGCAAI